MGGGGQQAGAAAAAEGGLAVADLTWIKPWKCGWEGCGDYMEKGVSQSYNDTHLKAHRADRAKQQKLEADREAARDQKQHARGGSSLRRLNRQKDMRAEAKRATNGKNKGGRGNGAPN